MTLRQLSCTAPVSSIVRLGDDFVLAGTAHYIVAFRIPTGTRSAHQRWSVLHRERIHKIVVTVSPTTWQCIVLGGKEVSLVQINSTDSSDLELRIVHRLPAADWIHDAAFFEDNILLLTAHNSILRYRLPSLGTDAGPQLVQTLHAAHRPLLWGGSFSASSYTALSEVKVAAGSMLGDVVNWSLGSVQDDGAEVEVADVHRLQGHLGSIYHLIFSRCGRWLASCSDDRTIRIWDVSARTPYLHLTLWGHESRVWRLAWLEDGKSLASVGEDCSLRLWTLDLLASPPVYSLVKTFKPIHEGKSVWALCIVELAYGARIALTGGADGAVKSWDLPILDSHDPYGNYLELDLPATSRPLKALLTWLDADSNHACAYITADGALYMCHLTEQHGALVQPPRLLYRADELRAAAQMQLSPDQGRLIVFTSHDLALEFDLIRQHPQNPLQYSLGISSLVCAWDRTGGNRIAVFDKKRRRVAVIDSIKFSILASLSIDKLDWTPKQRAITSVCFVPYADARHLLLLGNSTGHLTLAELGSYSSQILLQSRPHGDGVTSIRLLHSGKSLHRIETLSRDGVKSQVDLSFETGEWRMVVRHRIKLTKGVLEAPCQILDRDLFLAFVDAQAVLFDAEGNKMHWFVSPGTQSPYSFVDSKQALTYYRIVDGRLHRQQYRHPAVALPPRILLSGSHGREIRCVSRIRLRAGYDIIATGSEDAILRLSQVGANGALFSLHVDRQVPEGLKSLSWSNATDARDAVGDERLLLFGAGASQAVYAWSITAPSESARNDATIPEICVTPISNGSSLVPNQGNTDGPRTMAMDVWSEGSRHVLVTASSDGKIRAYSFDDHTNRLSMVYEQVEPTKCLITLQHVSIKLKNGRIRHLLITGASDGRLDCRDSTSLFEVADAFSREHSYLAPALVASWRLHQSGINALDVRTSGSSLSIVTGGDDNAVCTCVVDLDTLEPRDAATLPHAHASTIQGIKWLSANCFISSAVDQRLNVYQRDLDSESKAGNFNLVEAICLDSADCSAMDAWLVSESDDWRVVVTGFGVDVVHVRLPGAGKVGGLKEM